MKLNVKPKNRGTPAGAPDYQLYFRSQTVNTVQRSKILYNFYLVKKKNRKKNCFFFTTFPNYLYLGFTQPQLTICRIRFRTGMASR